MHVRLFFTAVQLKPTMSIFASCSPCNSLIEVIGNKNIHSKYLPTANFKRFLKLNMLSLKLKLLAMVKMERLF